jgi:predicted nuclease with TOPRIM domain
LNNKKKLLLLQNRLDELTNENRELIKSNELLSNGQTRELTEILNKTINEYRTLIIELKERKDIYDSLNKDIKLIKNKFKKVR